MGEGNNSKVVPRRSGNVYDCVGCGWQGNWVETDSGVCPECGDEVESEAEHETSM